MKIVIFVGSLKAKKGDSSTYALSLDVAEKLTEAARAANLEPEINVIYLNEFQLNPGTTREVDAEGDQGSDLYSLIEEADIIIFATPIWWGMPSSFIQRVIERMDEFDEYYLKDGKNRLYGKVFGMIVTGTEDGVQACQARMAGWAMNLGLTVPPETLAYWLHDNPYKKGEKDKTTVHYIETTAKNLVDWAIKLKIQPKTPKPEHSKKVMYWNER